MRKTKRKKTYDGDVWVELATEEWLRKTKINGSKKKRIQMRLAKRGC